MWGISVSKVCVEEAELTMDTQRNQKGKKKSKKGHDQETKEEDFEVVIFYMPDITRDDIRPMPVRTDSS
jgi:hypothetical protein